MFTVDEVNDLLIAMDQWNDDGPYNPRQIELIIDALEQYKEINFG